MLIENQVTVQAADGQAQALVYQPATDGHWPAVLFLMDAMGIRPTLRNMAQRLATAGYVVMLPDLYYREPSHETFTGADILTPGPKQDEIFRLYGSLKTPQVMADVDRFLTHLSNLEHVTKNGAGVLGYCMGGHFAMAALGEFGSRVSAAACIHGAALATDSPDSPHVKLPQAKGRLYIAAAEFDDYYPDDERKKLKSALKDSGVEHEYDDYPGVHHGFAVDDVPVYDKQAAELHWLRVLHLFDTTLKQKTAV